MSNIANIVVFDGAATPVSHTLLPVSVKSGPDGTIVANWREGLAGVPKEAQIQASCTLRTLKSGIQQVVWRVDTPVMEAVAGQNSSGYTAAPKVAYVDSDVWIKYVHPRSTTTGRRLNKQMLCNIANNVTTSVAAATAGAFDEAVCSLFMPT